MRKCVMVIAGGDPIPYRFEADAKSVKELIGHAKTEKILYANEKLDDRFAVEAVDVRGYPLRFAIEAMREGDWPEVRRIYAEGLRTGLAAFATSSPHWENWDRGHLQTGRLVARDNEGRVAGWSALSPVPDT